MRPYRKVSFPGECAIENFPKKFHFLPGMERSSFPPSFLPSPNSPLKMGTFFVPGKFPAHFVWYLEETKTEILFCNYLKIVKSMIFGKVSQKILSARVTSIISALDSANRLGPKELLSTPGQKILFLQIPENNSFSFSAFYLCQRSDEVQQNELLFLSILTIHS